MRVLTIGKQNHGGRWREWRLVVGKHEGKNHGDRRSVVKSMVIGSIDSGIRADIASRPQVHDNRGVTRYPDRLDRILVAVLDLSPADLNGGEVGTVFSNPFSPLRRVY